MVMLGDDELRRRLEYHPVSDATRPIYELNRALALLVGAVWDRMLPPGRELALAHTELEAALMRANQAVACGDPRMITGPADVDVATYLDDVLERLEGPTMRRSGPSTPLGGPDRPRRRDDEGITLPPGGRPPLGLSPLTARSGDELAQRRREHEGDDDL